MLRGLDKRFTKKQIYRFAEDPLRAVVRGTGMALKNIGKFKSI
jgi:rod shape-determining protein MreB